MSLERLFERARLVKTWLMEPEGKIFHEALRDYRHDKVKLLRTSKDSIDIYRAQGALEVLERLLSLRDDLDESLKKGA